MARVGHWNSRERHEVSLLMGGRKGRDEIGGQKDGDNPCSFGDNLEDCVGLLF